jgi:hypothetical protein
MTHTDNHSEDVLASQETFEHMVRERSATPFAQH